MDPVTQGLIGAAAAQLVVGKRVRFAGVIGAVGGMAPDLDVLIRSSNDPLMAVEFHRQFTHALAFIPFGGAIAALPFLLRKGFRAVWPWVLLASIVGYATHGLLDACTTYGTQLLWPFTNYRVSWSWISIVDPVFTLALAIGVTLFALRGKRASVATALIFCLLYMALGALQRERALDVQESLARSRGHEIVRRDAFPTLANQLVWRSLYEAGGMLYADRIRVPYFGRPQFTPGMQIKPADRASLTPRERANERVVRDFERFSWFSLGWVARAPDDPSIIGDVRYSLQTHSFNPIWGVRFHPHEEVPTEWVNRTGDRSLRLGSLWQELAGDDPAYRPVR